MTRLLRPIRDKNDTSRPRVRVERTGSREHPHLRLILPGERLQEPVHRGMWVGDPANDPALYTTLGDWPAPEAFEELLAHARAARNTEVVAELEADRAFCATVRANLLRARH